MGLPRYAYFARLARLLPAKPLQVFHQSGFSTPYFEFGFAVFIFFACDGCCVGYISLPTRYAARSAVVSRSFALGGDAFQVFNEFCGRWFLHATPGVPVRASLDFVCEPCEFRGIDGGGGSTGRPVGL